MRIYEELFIIKPDATDEESDQVIEQLKGVITGAGGTVDKAEKWGKRRSSSFTVSGEEVNWIST